HFVAVMARHLFLEGTEIAQNVRPAEFVVKRSAAQRAFGHDVQRADNTVRFAEIAFPRLFKAGNPQVRYRKTDQAGFGFGTDARRAFVADFPARTCRSTRVR